MDTKVSKMFVGVDVSKDTLDICIHEHSMLKVANSDDGIKNIIKFIKPHNIGQIVCEATGGYETLMINTLSSKGYKVWNADPARIKAFAKSEGIKFKTDAHDAKIIARFAAYKTCPYEQYVFSKKELTVRDLSRRRSDAIKMILMEKKRLNHPKPNLSKQYIEEHITFLKRQINQLDSVIAKTIEKDKVMKAKCAIIESMPGIGPVTSAAIISSLPECGSVNNKQIAALVGVAPYTQESGKSHWQSFTKGGRFEPRQKLYMAALVGTRFNPVLKKFYQHLVGQGKRKKIALIAVARKIIVILNTMLKNGTFWNENHYISAQKNKGTIMA